MRSWNVFWRGSKARWYIKYAPEWKQRVVPPEAAAGPKARRAAEEWARSLVANLDAPPVPPAEPTLAELAQRFLQLKQGDERKATSTREAYAEHLRLSILPELGHLRPAELDTSHLRAFIRSMRKALGASTVRNRWSTLKVFLRTIRSEKWATVDTEMLDDPAVLEELPELPVYSRKVLRPEAFARLLQCPAVPPVARLRDLLAACAGLCDGEIAGLRVRSVAGGILAIETAVQLRGPQGFATEGRTKNKYRVRVLPQHPAIAAAIQWWLAEGFEMHVCRPPVDGDYLLPNERGGPWRPKSAKALRVHLELAGVEAPEGFTFHALRACFATWLEQSGASSECRARLMGHRPKTTAAAHYTGELLAEDLEAISRIPIPIVDLGACLVPAGATPAPNRCQSAPPARIGLATFGLGNRETRLSLVPAPGECGAAAAEEAPDSAPGSGLGGGDGIAAGAGLVPALAGAQEGIRWLRVTWEAGEHMLERLAGEGTER